MVWLRSNGEFGLEIVVSLLFVIWATDTGAYLAGKSVGGPKLIPRVSPSKTWAGLAGGVFWAAVFAVLAAYVLDFRPIALFAAFGACLAVVAQVGDIAESAVKRHFHAKDTSGFIPGHGGVLDRFDGLMFAVIAAALLLFVWQNLV
jgi:phosphatidate cytidylyltransferase